MFRFLITRGWLLFRKIYMNRFFHKTLMELRYELEQWIAEKDHKISEKGTRFVEGIERIVANEIKNIRDRLVDLNFDIATPGKRIRGAETVLGFFAVPLAAVAILGQTMPVKNYPSFTSWIPNPSHTQESANNSIDSRVLNVASEIHSRFHYMPYRWGTEGLQSPTGPEFGYDCSGYVWHTLRRSGINVERVTASDYALYWPIDFSLNRIQNGDLIYFHLNNDKWDRYATHMGIYAGTDVRGRHLMYDASSNVGHISRRVIPGRYLDQNHFRGFNRPDVNPRITTWTGPESRNFLRRAQFDLSLIR